MAADQPEQDEHHNEELRAYDRSERERKAQKRAMAERFGIRGEWSAPAELNRPFRRPAALEQAARAQPCVGKHPVPVADTDQRWRQKPSRSEEHTSELQSPDHL